MRIFGRWLPVLVIALAPPAAPAAESVDAALRSCRAEADDARRLACYDRIAERAQPVAPQAAPAPKAAPPAAAAPAAATGAAVAEAANPGAEEDFGLERAKEREEARRQEEKARALGELEASVTKIETRMDGLMTITLDNGQVWRQNRPDSRFRLKTGDRVRIQPGSLSSYILSGPTNKSTRVTRVK
jgi:hypothetical protein